MARSLFSCHSFIPPQFDPFLISLFAFVHFFLTSSFLNFILSFHFSTAFFVYFSTPHNFSPLYLFLCLFISSCISFLHLFPFLPTPLTIFILSFCLRHYLCIINKRGDLLTLQKAILSEFYASCFSFLQLRSNHSHFIYNMNTNRVEDKICETCSNYSWDSLHISMFFSLNN